MAWYLPPQTSASCDRSNYLSSSLVETWVKGSPLKSNRIFKSSSRKKSYLLPLLRWVIYYHDEKFCCRCSAASTACCRDAERSIMSDATYLNTASFTFKTRQLKSPRGFSGMLWKYSIASMCANPGNTKGSIWPPQILARIYYETPLNYTEKLQILEASICDLLMVGSMIGVDPTHVMEKNTINPIQDFHRFRYLILFFFEIEII